VIRFLDYNIWNYSGNWPRRRELLLNIMQHLQPDVICLQEVRHSWHDRPGENQARWLGRRLGYHVIYRPASLFWPLPPIVEGLAILTPEPVQRWAAYPLRHALLSGPRRVILHAEVQGFDIYNVHFALSPKGRLLNAVDLVRIVKTTACGPAIVMGDFNADPSEPPMQYLRNAGFVDLWTLFHPHDEQPTDPAWSPRRRLDYALGYGQSHWRGSMQLIGTEACGDSIYPSDHAGLLLELER
jgi:endonuclease/exonuclease/phosphatase family metal-dependent hydrolase